MLLYIAVEYSHKSVAEHRFGYEVLEFLEFVDQGHHELLSSVS
jgi:hypothetical protein